MHLQLMRHLRTCTDEWTPNTLCSHDQKSAGAMAQLRSKPSSKCTPAAKNNQATGGCFMQHLSRYSARLVEERQ